MLNYEASQDCNLMVIGHSMDEKGLGIALPPGSPYLKDITLGLLKMADSGYLSEMEIK